MPIARLLVRLPVAMQRRFVTDDLIPMTIADRAMAAAEKKGALKNLSGAGKPLTYENTQAHVTALPKNIEARAEAEMRRAARTGLLSNLGGEGEPLPEERALHGAGSGGAASQQKIQQMVKAGLAHAAKE